MTRAPRIIGKGTVIASSGNQVFSIPVRQLALQGQGVSQDLMVTIRQATHLKVAGTPAVVATVADTNAPTVPTGLQATVISSTQINLAWNASTDTSGVVQSGVEKYRLRRDGAIIANITAPTLVYQNTGLTPSTQYSYRVSALDFAANESAQATAVLATTDAALVPANPVNLVATAFSSTRIDLTWAAGSGGPTVTSYELSRSLNGTSGWTIISAALVTSFSDTGRTASTQYFYRVNAFAGATPSNGYATANATTQPVTGTAAFFIAVGLNTFNGQSAAPAGGGSNRAVQPGEIIEFDPGARGSLVINDVIGTAALPITIRGPQTSGQCVLTSGSAFTLRLDSCRYFTLDGSTTSTNSPIRVDGKRHGIKIIGTAGHTAILKFKGSGSTSAHNGSDANGYDNTRNCTIRYLELDGSWTLGGAGTGGIGISSNDSNLALATYPTSWQESMIFEHNYIHNTRAEGMYIGPNASKHAGASGGIPDVPLRYIKIRYNWLVDVGGDALNGKSWFGGTPGADGATENSIHHNVVIRGGTNTVDNNGTDSIALRAAKANIYNNWVEDSGSWGINPSVQEGANIGDPGGVYTWRIYNNVVRGCGTFETPRGGIHTATGTGIPASMYPTAYVYNNTVTQSVQNGVGIEFSAKTKAASFIRNNVSVGNAGAQINYSPAPSEPTKNLTAGTAVSVFADAFGTKELGDVDFHLNNPSLVDGSSVIGTDLALRDFDDDVDRVLLTADKGAYEHP